MSEKIRHELSQWCADRVPNGERGSWQVGYTTHGDDVTILDRRPPTFPELDTEWSATPVAQLRQDDPDAGQWSLYLPGRGEEEWQRDGQPAADPIVLLDRLRG